MAASRKPITSKKRKVSDDPQHQRQDEKAKRSKKKSPLFNLPQNFYAPPSISSMSNDELKEWRKEQRRKRNRESAAASRNKTREKIDELEGEVDKWRRMNHDMEVKMRCMERHMQFLARSVASARRGQQPGLVAPMPPHQPAQVVSNPNSPPTSFRPHASPPVVPNIVTSSVPPPPAYSSHKGFTPVEKREAAHALASKESKKHINEFPRKVVEIGADFDSSTDNLKQPQPQLPTLPAHDPLAMNKEYEEACDNVSSSVIPEEASKVREEVSTLESSSPESSDDDEDFLDFLVDTLDGEFDTDLLI